MLKDKSPDKIIQQQSPQTETISMKRTVAKKKKKIQLYKPIIIQSKTKGVKKKQSRIIFQNTIHG